MPRYRLPEALGGGEYEALTNYKSKVADVWRFRFNVPGVGFVDVPGDALTEVAPPLPEEPPTGSVVLDADGQAWQRAKSNLNPWYCVHAAADEDWAGLNTYGPLTLLVPDPFGEPIELPWSSDGNNGYSTRVGLYGPQKPGVILDGVRDCATGGTGIQLSPAVARAKALALLTAADKAEAMS